jgi:hypothetical protein
MNFRDDPAHGRAARSAHRLRALLERFPHMVPAAPVPELEGGIMGFARRPLLVRLAG